MRAPHCYWVPPNELETWSGESTLLITALSWEIIGATEKVIQKRKAPSKKDSLLKEVVKKAEALDRDEPISKARL